MTTNKNLINQPHKLELTYFDAPARAEVTRLVLAYGNVSFKDTRLSFEQYGAEKSSLDLPFGQVPTLQVGGKAFGQSLAIARYAAKAVGLYPKEPLVALEVDSLVDTIVEVFNEALPILFLETDQVVRQAKLTHLNDNVIPRCLTNLQQRVQGPYFTGDQVTLADIYLLDVIEHLVRGFPGQISVDTHNYPQLESIVDKLHKSPQLAAYYKAKDVM